MHFTNSILPSFATALLMFSGAQAAMPLEQITGGLIMFRDMANQLQPAANGLNPSPLAALTKSNQGNLQQCSDGFAQAMQMGGGFVNGIDGTPALSGDDADEWRSSIADAYTDCANSHLLLLKTVSNAHTGVGYGNPQGQAIASSMDGLSAIVRGLTADLIEIVGADSDAAKQLDTNKAKLLNGMARAKACYSADLTGIGKCSLLRVQGY